MAKQQKPAWVYLIAGLIIGLFVAFLVFLSQQDSGRIDIKTAIEERAARKDTREVRQNTHSAPSKPCLLYTSPSPRDQRGSRMPSSA